VEWVLVHVIAAPVLGSPVALALGGRWRGRGGWFTVLPLAYSTALLLTALATGHWRLEAVYPWVPSLGPLRLVLDALNLPVLLTVLLLCTVVAAYSVRYMEGERGLGLYHALYLLYSAGMVGTVLSANLALFFVFFEMMIVPSWALIAMWGTGNREVIALKYFVFTEAGALSLLAGMLLLYSSLGTMDLPALAAGAGALPRTVALAAAVAMMVGLFVKMAVFPLHTWLPDAHAEAPTPISALLSPAMIGIGGYAVARIVGTIFPWVLAGALSFHLLVLALVTMVYGGLMALAQDDFKRLLAYSSISQMGYMLMGLSSPSHAGLLGALLLYVSHGLSKAALFMVSGIFMRRLGTRRVSDIRGLATSMPWTAVTALLGFLGLAGVPPLLGFWAKLFVFAGALYAALTPLDALRLATVLVAIVSSIVTAAYGLWTVKRVFYGEASEPVLRVRGDSWDLLAPALFLVAVSVVLGVYPTALTLPSAP